MKTAQCGDLKVLSEKTFLKDLDPDLAVEDEFVGKEEKDNDH